jgi:ubiquinone/menaquinone biosynthesis C-methylase UbiE
MNIRIASNYDFTRLSEFLEQRKNDVYKEPNDNRNFIEGGIDSIKDRIKEGDRVLDVGCGHGLALELFKELDAIPTGITLSEEDKLIAEAKGFDIQIMDMSFMNFPDEHFDILWSRHSIEHSIFPYYTLSEFYRVLKHGGTAYFEMPGDMTDAQHEQNQNHYSVFHGQMWFELLRRVGFKNMQTYIINFDYSDYEDQKGEDFSYRFIAEK